MLGLLQERPIQPQRRGIPHPITLSYDSIDLKVFDMGGKIKNRALWPMFLADVHGVVFVVDSADDQRFAEAADALHQLVRHPFASGKFVLVVANKQDMPLACSAQQVAWQLALEQYPEHLYAPFFTFPGTLRDGVVVCG